MGEEDFQRENFKFREREYRYYAEANRDRLPRLPDLADNAGGLSNPAYFNFISYCLWKVVYRHATQPAEREAFARACAADFLGRVWPEGARQAGAVPAGVSPGEAAVRGAVLPFLELLRRAGYICSYQVVLGGHPGSWPQDWMISQPALLYADEAAGAAGATGAEDVGEGAGAAQPGGLTGAASPPGDFLFQIKLHRPADILGSVALRSEEGGAWPHTVSSCLGLLLEKLGYRAAGMEGEAAAALEGGRAQGTAAGDDGAAAAAVALSSGGAETLGARVASLSPAAVAATAAGKGYAECDEFFYQDEWQGPKGLRDRLLLLLGDPLEQVGVDFVPTTLVQNWRLRSAGV